MSSTQMPPSATDISEPSTVEHAVSSDSLFVDWQVLQQLRESGRRRLAALSGREDDVLRLVVLGHPNKAIAQQLKISIKTVEKHRSRLMSKLKVKTPPDLMRIWLQANPSDLISRPILNTGRTS